MASDPMDDLTNTTARAVFSADFTVSDAEIAAMGPAALETYRAIAQQIIEAQQAHLRERGLLLGPDGLLRAGEVPAVADRSCFDCGAAYETEHAPDCPDRCPHCGSEGWDNDHRDGCPTLGTCAQTDPWLDPPWHADADYCQPFTSECWREHLATHHAPLDPPEDTP